MLINKRVTFFSVLSCVAQCLLSKINFVENFSEFRASFDRISGKSNPTNFIAPAAAGHIILYPHVFVYIDDSTVHTPICVEKSLFERPKRFLIEEKNIN